MNFTLKARINIKLVARFLILTPQQANAYPKFITEILSCESVKHHEGDKSIYELESCSFYFTIALQ